MAGTPNRTLREMLAGNIDWDDDTLRIALYDTTVAYQFDPDAHNFVNDILDGGTTANELSGTVGYTSSADRQTVTTTTTSTDNIDDEGVLDGDDVTWSGVEASADIQGWILYKQVGTDDTTPGDDPVLIVVDDDMADAPADLPRSADGSDVIISWNSEGIATLGVV